jgi:flagellar basal-body rod protein FlgB
LLIPRRTIPRGKADDVSDTLFGIHGTALALRSQRMGLITSNLANASTPGYKARDIDFAAAMKAADGGQSVDAAGQAATRYRVPTMPSLDGNTVETMTEQTAFAENAVGYSATLTFIRGRVETVTRALKGE